MHSNNNKITALIILSLLLLFVTACAELDSHSSINRFQKSENAFKSSLRWGEWENVFQLLKPNPDNPSSTLEPPTEEQLKYLDNIKVVHVETLKSGITEKDKTGESLLLIEYHFDNSTKIHQIRHDVNWWRHKESNIWLTDTPLPKEFDMPESKTIKLSPEKN